jgi:plastocyanin
MRRVAALTALAILALTSGASAAGRAAAVHLGAEGPMPSVVVVPPGASVRWVNDDSLSHSLRGEVHSPAIPPGGAFTRRFQKTGEYRYHDATNSAFRGTVVVAAGGAGGGGESPPPPSSHGLVRHEYSAVVTLRDRERYRFYDGKYRSFHGPCNGEIGEGTRTEALRVRFRTVTYTGIGRTEVLVSHGSRADLEQHEFVDAHASSDSSPLTACPDESTERAPNTRVHCEESAKPPPGGFRLGWTPRAENRFLLLPNRSSQEEVCGLAYVGPLSLTGLELNSLPISMVPEGFAYDSATVGPLTDSEVAAIRTGRRLTVSREVHLSWLDTCCTAWVTPGFGGVLARIGSAWSWDAEVTIRLKPR